MLDFLFSIFWTLFYYASVLFGICSLGSMLLMQLYQLFLWYALPRKNFKESYGDWALVTGASSGIGAAIVEILAQQKVNVVLVALKDEVLSKKVSELKEKYPDLEFRECGCNLGATDPREYMQPIIANTQDIDIRAVFNNAAFINFGFFFDCNIEKMRANMICNASSTVEITHYFGQKMLSSSSSPSKKSNLKKKKGFIGFTSSCGSYMPSPTALLYGPTKAFLSNFGVSLASENFDSNLDILVLNSGPVATGFYNHSKDMPCIEATKQMAVGAHQVASCFFVSAGRVAVFENGILTVGFKLFTKLLDSPVVSELFRRFAQFSPDHQNCIKRSRTRQLQGGTDEVKNE